MGFSKPLRRSIVSASLTAIATLSAAPPASAAVTIGQLAPAGTLSQSTFVTDRLQPTVTSGNSYVVPAIAPNEAITSWSFNATGADPGQMMTMKVFRKVAEPATYRVVGHDGPRPISPGLNTFPANVPVQPGDVLGTGQPVHVQTAAWFNAPGDSHLFLLNGGPGGNLADGEQAPFNPFSDARVNVSATVSASNAFTLGKITRNQKTGTATITVSVPNPGDLTASGKGVKAAGAATSKSVGAGQAQLLIRAKGKKKRTLNDTGKVKLRVAVRYTPTGGEPKTDSVKVKLRKRR